MRAPRAAGERPPHADGMVTDNPELTLFMRFADCVPVLLYDPRRHAVGIVHAGWKGTLARIAARAVTRMEEAFGTQPADLLAAIGPSIGPDHYPVGAEVVEATRRAFARDAARLLPERNGETCLDLWQANALALQEAGVGEVEVAAVCTACNTSDWFSHRGEQGRTVRLRVDRAARGLALRTRPGSRHTGAARRSDGTHHARRRARRARGEFDPRRGRDQGPAARDRRGRTAGRADAPGRELRRGARSRRSLPSAPARSGT